MAEVLPDAAVLIDMPWRSVWAMTFSRACCTHTYHGDAIMSVLRRAVTAIAQTWWLAVGDEM
jgi:hypothetical protein